jgi:hypothetical protein
LFVRICPRFLSDGSTRETDIPDMTAAVYYPSSIVAKCIEAYQRFISPHKGFVPRADEAGLVLGVCQARRAAARDRRAAGAATRAVQALREGSPRAGRSPQRVAAASAKRSGRATPA